MPNKLTKRTSRNIACDHGIAPRFPPVFAKKYHAIPSYAATRSEAPSKPIATISTNIWPQQIAAFRHPEI
ncbi:MAG: hypothetical protein ACREJ2_00985 [Planctomycetota bacterium]